VRFEKNPGDFNLRMEEEDEDVSFFFLFQKFKGVL